MALNRTGMQWVRKGAVGSQSSLSVSLNGSLHAMLLKGGASGMVASTMVLMRHLVAVAGPIGAGKSTVATLLAGKARASGLTCSLADLDDIAFSQRSDLPLEEYWRRAGVAHSALVRGWFDAGVDVVVAHGPFFESNSYESLRAAAPGDVRHHHVLLRVTFEVALSRVQADPGRGPGARSTQPELLRATHQVFAEMVDSLPTVDVEMDTTGRTAAEVADQVFDLLDLE